MDQHLGASITLSFALVVVFAVVLYQPEKTPLAPSPPGAATVAGQGPPARPTDRAPPLTPGEPLPELSSSPTSVPSFRPTREDDGATENDSKSNAPPRPEPERRVKSSGGGIRSRVTTDGHATRTGPGATAPSLVPVTHRQSREVPAHDAFTEAYEGETLRDVASRVYGSPEEDEALWRLNRDLIGRRDDALSAGTLLRTP
jgi:nucleoid-associated protein YgaU